MVLWEPATTLLLNQTGRIVKGGDCVAIDNPACNVEIILASPGTLIALLRSAALGWREARLAEHAEQVKGAGEAIYQRIGKVAEHITKLGKALGRSVEAYNDTVGSMERNLLTSAQELHRLHVSSQPVDAPGALQVSLRSFVKPELTSYVADESASAALR